MHPLEQKCEEGFLARTKPGPGQFITNMGEARDNQPEGASVIGRSMSREECELLQEHRKLRQEMAMLRKEFRAFRESFQREVKR